MIVIFGWGHRTTEWIGPLTAAEADIAGMSDTWFDLCKVKKWFTFFFIPLFPTGADYVLLNDQEYPVRELTEEEFEKLKPVADLNRAAQEGAISREEFENRKASFG